MILHKTREKIHRNNLIVIMLNKLTNIYDEDKQNNFKSNFYKFLKFQLTRCWWNWSASGTAIHKSGVQLLSAGTVEHRTRLPGAHHGALFVTHAGHAGRLKRLQFGAHSHFVAPQLTSYKSI